MHELPAELYQPCCDQDYMRMTFAEGAELDGKGGQRWLSSLLKSFDDKKVLVGLLTQARSLEGPNSLGLTCSDHVTRCALW